MNRLLINRAFPDNYPGWPKPFLAGGLRLVLIFWCLAGANPAAAADCLYVSSYHAGYEWSDRIERAIETTLGEQCRLSRFYLDTERDISTEHARRMALQAKQQIDKMHPDVIIACDDNASKFLVQPYLKDGPVPVVFCGVSWSIEPYGYPYSNATGMVEVAPVRPMLDEIKEIVKNPVRGIYLSSDIYTERNDFEYYRRICVKQGIRLEGVFVKNLATWKSEFRKAQQTGIDFIVLGNNAGIGDWNVNEVMQFTPREARVLSVTNYDWMLPYSMMAMVKLPEEQGEWAAKAALSILNGFHVADIPIVVNRRWELHVNPYLFSKADIRIPKQLSHKAIMADYQ